MKIAHSDEAEFEFFVPGIREGHPRLEPGDLVHLRMVPDQRNSGGGWAFEARVTTLRMREGYVRT